MNYEDIFNYLQIRESQRTNPEQWILHEGLILTHGIGDTISVLTKHGIKIYHHAYDRFTIKFESSKYKTLTKIFGLVNNMGWFPATIQPFPMDFDVKSQPFNQDRLEEYIYEYDGFLITFEAKFELEAPLPKYLYHLTLKKNLDRILKQGLTPREDSSKRAYHPPRIYFAAEQQYVEDLADYMSPEPLKNKSNKLSERGNGVILKIVTSNLPAYFKLYSDPNFKGRGFFTVNNVPPSLIKVENEVPIKGKDNG